MESKISLPVTDGPPQWQMNLKDRRAPRVIAVTSGKRGVGRSSIVVNLGLTLALMGKRVLILDADLSQAHIAPFLGLTPLHTINDFFAGLKSLAEVMVDGPRGLKVLPAVPARRELFELSQAQKLFLLDELDAFAGDFDFLLVDTGAGVSGDVLYFNSGAQERIVVADHEPDSVIEAYTLIKVLATRYAEKRFKLLFNKIRRPEEAQLYFDRLTKVTDRFLHGSVSLEYLGFIPLDQSLPESVGAQTPLMELSAAAPAGQAFSALASTLSVQEPYTAMDGNIKFFWQTLNRRAADAFGQGESHASRLR